MLCALAMTSTLPACASTYALGVPDIPEASEVVEFGPCLAAYYTQQTDPAKPLVGAVVECRESALSGKPLLRIEATVDSPAAREWKKSLPPADGTPVPAQGRIGHTSAKDD